MSTDADREAYAAATIAVRKIIAQSKNPRTVLGRMSPSTVAWHAAWAAIQVWQEHQENAARNQERRP